MQIQSETYEEVMALFGDPEFDAPDRAARFLKSLAHRDRLKTLCSLVDQELSVAQIELQVGASQSSVSQHLARLKEEGILSSRRDGRKILYKISDPLVLKLVALLYERFCAEEVN